MYRYLLLWNCGTGPEWKHEFEMASDRIALDYTNRIIKANKEMHNASRIYLWRLTPEQLLDTYSVEIKVNTKRSS